MPQETLLDDVETEVKPRMKSAKSAPKNAPRATAESMAAKQRDISVSEFFAKNRHLLGFDSPRKAVLTTVKEAVDNSLDACEEAGILPDITVVIEDLEPNRPASAKSSKYRITVVDNGPGIVRKQVENVFGRLLFGSKFHRLKMSRGQQGIGISAAGMYGLITTGKPMVIQTRPHAHKPAHHIELAMNTKTNRAEVTVDEETDDFPLKKLRELNTAVRDLAANDEFLSHKAYPTGTSVTIDLEGKYQKGRGSVDEFLELTAIANPHAKITLVRPTRTTGDETEEAELTFNKKSKAKAEIKTVDEDGKQVASAATPEPPPSPKDTAVTEDLGPLVLFPRAVDTLPPETKEIQPHPRGVELGTLLQMLKDYQESDGGTLYNFLQEKFCRVSSATAGDFCKAIGATSRTKVSDIESPQAEKLYKEFQEAKLAPPPTDCLAPIGVQQLLKGMFKGVRAEFYAASSREAAVYRGRPFLIEAAIAFGGQLPTEDTSRVIRFANRVPLLFQQSACSAFKGVAETNWRNYDLQQPRGGLPVGPLVIMIHMASVWVPFTSESKEAIADYDEIRKEMKLALMECGRKLGTYLRKRAKMKREGERRDVFQKYIGEISKAVSAINGEDTKKLYDALLAQAKKRTAIADQQLDDEGRKIKEEDPADQEGVLIVESAMDSVASVSESDDDDAPASAKSKSSRSRASLDDIPSDAPTAKKAKAAAAALKVAAMQHDDEPTSLDVKPAKRQEAKSERSAPAKKVASKKSEPAAKAASSKQSSKTPSKPAELPKPAAKPATPAKGEKPRVRLVNGKYVPVDEPKLF
ncbi:MAG: DNA topoisomerase VI subunit B [Phycisphaerales bacterium]